MDFFTSQEWGQFIYIIIVFLIAFLVMIHKMNKTVTILYCFQIKLLYCHLLGTISYLSSHIWCVYPVTYISLFYEKNKQKKKTNNKKKNEQLFFYYHQNRWTIYQERTTVKEECIQFHQSNDWGPIYSNPAILIPYLDYWQEEETQEENNFYGICHASTCCTWVQWSFEWMNTLSRAVTCIKNV